MNIRSTSLIRAASVVAAVLASTGLALARPQPPVSLPDSGSTVGMVALGLIAVGAMHRVLRRRK